VLAALEPLRRQTYASDALELVVVIDRCTDDTTGAIAERFGNSVSVIDSAGTGQAAALNSGIDFSSGDLLIFLDDEMVPVPGFVDAHVRCHAESSDARIAVTGFSPVITSATSSAVERSVASTFEAFHRRMASPDRRDAPTDMNGGNFSIRRSTLIEVGGFNSSYFFQRNDFELAARLLTRGYRFRYCPEARADQHVAVSEDAVIARSDPRAVNDLRLAREFPRFVEFLPFAVPARSKWRLRRWRMLWVAPWIAPVSLRVMRRVFGQRARLVGWEYTARYVRTLRRELGTWQAFTRLIRQPTEPRP